MKIVIGAVVAVLVAVGAMAKLGVIELPGISPAKKRASAQSQYAVDADADAKVAAPAAKDPEREQVQAHGGPIGAAPATESPQRTSSGKEGEPVQGVDPYAGQKKLAKVWADLDAASIARIVEDWKDEDLAKQLFAMPPAQGGEVLAALKPERASKLSRLIQRLGEEKARRDAEAASK